MTEKQAFFQEIGEKDIGQKYAPGKTGKNIEFFLNYDFNLAGP